MRTISNEESTVKINTKAIEKIITEQITRLRNDFRPLVAGAPRPTTPGCGCEHDVGCCKDRGCCGDEGGCGDIFSIFGDRLDIFKDYVESNKEPIKEFFKEKGVDLNF